MSLKWVPYDDIIACYVAKTKLFAKQLTNEIFDN